MIKNTAYFATLTSFKSQQQTAPSIKTNCQNLLRNFTEIKPLATTSENQRRGSKNPPKLKTNNDFRSERRISHEIICHVMNKKIRPKGREGVQLEGRMLKSRGKEWLSITKSS